MKNHVAAVGIAVILGAGLCMLPEQEPTEGGPEPLWVAVLGAAPHVVDSDAELRAAQRRIEQHGAIVQALCAQRLTLLEAAVCFDEIGRDCNHHRFFRGDSQIERVCRQVIHWTALQDPGVACQLEFQLEDILGASVGDVPDACHASR